MGSNENTATADTGVLPKDYETEAQKLYKEWTDLNQATSIKERNKKISANVKSLDKLISKNLPEDDTTLDSYDKQTKKQKAANIVTSIAEKYWSARSGKRIEVNEDMINTALRDAGIDLPYNKVIEEIMDAEDLSYSNLDNEHPLKKLIQYVANEMHTPSKRLNEIQRTVAQNVEYHEPWKDMAGKDLGIRYDNTASIDKVFRDQQAKTQETMIQSSYKRPRSYSDLLDTSGQKN